jgi:hypothetical protein
MKQIYIEYYIKYKKAIQVEYKIWVAENVYSQIYNPFLPFPKNSQMTAINYIKTLIPKTLWWLMNSPWITNSNSN